MSLTKGDIERLRIGLLCGHIEATGVNDLCDLALSALTARSEGFRQGVEAAARVCDSYVFKGIAIDDLWLDGANTACKRLATAVSALSPRETDAAPQAVLTGSEATQIASSHRPTAEPAVAAPNVASMVRQLDIAIEADDEEANKNTGLTEELDDALRALDLRGMRALLSKVGQGNVLVSIGQDALKTAYLVDGNVKYLCDCPARTGKCPYGVERKLHTTELSRCLLPPPPPERP